MRNRNIIIDTVTTSASNNKFFSCIIVLVMMCVFACPLNAKAIKDNPDTISDILKRQQQHQLQYETSISSIVQASKDTIQSVIDKSNEKHEITCIAKNIYYESRNQSYSGRTAVAFVTINRSKLRNLPPCQVVYQKNLGGCQFTWTCELGKAVKPGDQDSWHESLVIAYISYHKLVDDVTSGAIYYFNFHQVHPKWAMSKVPITNSYISNGYLGDHRFFAPQADEIALN